MHAPMLHAPRVTHLLPDRLDAQVETIGDAYMCVCGLPTQTAAHAERMADFALGMFAAVEKACHITGAQLQIRVGMHSGTVTAGVLLGERSRFQLFGDTVNTASRSKPRNQLHPARLPWFPAKMY